MGLVLILGPSLRMVIGQFIIFCPGPSGPFEAHVLAPSGIVGGSAVYFSH